MKGMESMMEVSQCCGNVTTEILDYEKLCRSAVHQVTSTDVLKPGDHLRWKASHGIIISSTNLENHRVELELIRYCNFPRMQVNIETYTFNQKEDKIYRFDYGQDCHPPAVVVERARACVGQRGYNVLRNDNEDFSRWCKAGKHTYIVIDEAADHDDLDVDTDKIDSINFHVKGLNSLEDIQLSDHVAWSLIEADKPFEEWSHGVVSKVNYTRIEVIGHNDTTHSISKIYFNRAEFAQHRFHSIVYGRCHLPDLVTDRAEYFCGSRSVCKESKAFAVWAKTGLPRNAMVDDVVLIKPKDFNQDTPSDNKSVATRVAGAGGRSTASTVARTVPRTVARGVVEGAAAAAAVGVEVVVLAVDVGLTYREFHKTGITKDELHKRNIEATSRGVGAAGGAVGGGAAGAAIGTLVFPGIGTIVGGIIGGIAGGITGQVGGHFAGKGIAFAAARPYDALFVDPAVKELDGPQGSQS